MSVNMGFLKLISAGLIELRGLTGWEEE